MIKPQRATTRSLALTNAKCKLRCVNRKSSLRHIPEVKIVADEKNEPRELTIKCVCSKPRRFWVYSVAAPPVVPLHTQTRTDRVLFIRPRALFITTRLRLSHVVYFLTRHQEHHQLVRRECLRPTMLILSLSTAPI